jgi:hypothetical protein
MLVHLCQTAWHHISDDHSPSTSNSYSSVYWGVVILLSAAKNACHILKLKFPFTSLNKSIALTEFFKKW